MATLSKPPIPLKLYKHFAVVTLLLTLTIAMFADSGNRQAMADHVDERQRMEALRAAEAERLGPRELVRRDEGARGSFGDEGYGYGAPTAASQANGGSGRRAPRRRPQIAGFAPQYVNSLPEHEYQALISSLPASQRAAAEEEIQESTVADMARASARRSGRRDVGADAPD